MYKMRASDLPQLASASCGTSFFLPFVVLYFVCYQFVVFAFGSAVLWPFILLVGDQWLRIVLGCFRCHIGSVKMLCHASLY